MDQELKELLLSMQGEIRSIHTELAGVKQVQEEQGKTLAEQGKTLAGQGKTLAAMQKDLSEVKDRTTKIEVTLENDIKTDLKLLHEGQQGINEKFAKLDKVADDVEDIKIKVSAIEHVTQDNTSQIQQLRKVN